MSPSALRSRLADWFGLNRATVAVLVVIGCLGLSEEIWSNFLALHLKDLAPAADPSQAAIEAVWYAGIIASLRNLLEGFGYLIGGTVAHRLGARVALAVSAAPMAIGFVVMLSTREPWLIAAAALLMTNWEPLSVPATFDVVGSEVPKNRRTIAFAVQSIQKRLPKIVGPAIGGIAFAVVGYWLNLTLAFLCLGLAVVLQLLRVQVVHADRAAAVAAVAGQRRLGFERARVVVGRHGAPISFSRCGAGYTLPISQRI